MVSVDGEEPVSISNVARNTRVEKAFILQKISGRVSPAFANLHTMGKIPHVAEHASILHCALFTVLVRLILTMRTDESKDSLEDALGELSNELG